MEGRVDALPAAAGLPVFDPGVGVELVHQQIVARRIQFAALVAGHHPRRDAGRAQDEGHGPGVVLAEAAAGVEEEAVDALRPGGRRAQGVGEGLLAEMPQQRLHQRLRPGMLAAQFRGPGAGARVAAGRQLQVEAGGADAAVGLAQSLRPGGDPVEQRLVHRPPPLEVEVAHQPRILRRLLRRIQGEQPGPLAGLHDHLVAHRLALPLHFRQLVAARLADLRPARAVEALQGQRPPVQLAARRRRAIEADAEGQRGGLAEFDEIPRHHRIAEAGGGLGAGHGQRPQRPQARE
ncbi:hypothetical protein D3C76_951150 [compost metagenome]